MPQTLINMCIVSKNLVCPVENDISENLYQGVFKKLSFLWPKMLFICVEKGQAAQKNLV